MWSIAPSQGDLYAISNTSTLGFCQWIPNQTAIILNLIEETIINSSNWQCFCIEVLSRGSHRKYTKGNWQLLVAAWRRLILGVRGPGEKPSWGETWSSDTGGSQSGQGSWSVSRGVAHIPQSLGTKGNQEGWPLLGGVQIRCDRGSTPWIGYFSGPVSKGLLWGKVQPGVALPYHSFYWEARQ